MRYRLIISLLFFVCVLVLSSCSSVKSYQKVLLNDDEMELSARKLEYYESSFQTYREGSSGAEGGKIGGGCGCN
jgi:hypothetical protein